MHAHTPSGANHHLLHQSNKSSKKLTVPPCVQAQQTDTDTQADRQSPRSADFLASLSLPRDCLFIISRPNSARLAHAYSNQVLQGCGINVFTDDSAIFLTLLFCNQQSLTVDEDHKRYGYCVQRLEYRHNKLSQCLQSLNGQIHCLGVRGEVQQVSAGEAAP